MHLENERSLEDNLENAFEITISTFTVHNRKDTISNPEYDQ